MIAVAALGLGSVSWAAAAPPAQAPVAAPPASALSALLSAGSTTLSGPAGAISARSAATSRSDAVLDVVHRATTERSAAAVDVAVTDGLATAVEEAETATVHPAPGHRVTSRVGERWGRMHEGTDFSVPVGTPLLAAEAGTVTSAAWSDGLGHHVRLETADGEELVYGHLSELHVERGDRVSPGDEVGLSGNSGRSTGPHLHFEVRVDGLALDSLDWLADRGAA